MIKYTFTAYDDEEGREVALIVKDEEYNWKGYNGPVYQFLLFLRGVGFIFDPEAELVIYNPRTGDIRQAVED